MLIIVNINVNNLDLDSVIQCLYLINNLQESLINLYTIYICLHGLALPGRVDKRDNFDALK